MTSPPNPLAADDDNVSSESPVAGAAAVNDIGSESPAAGAESRVGSPESPAAGTESPAVFDIGDSVLAEWSPRKWFLAHVTAINMGAYDLYFQDCGNVKLAWAPKKIKPCPVSKDGLPVPRRGDFINKVFFDDGVGVDDHPNIPAGMWLVRTIKGNEFFCVRSPNCRNKDVTPNSTTFDIGYVMRSFERAEQNIRNEF